MFGTITGMDSPEHERRHIVEYMEAEAPDETVDQRAPSLAELTRSVCFRKQNPTKPGSSTCRLSAYESSVKLETYCQIAFPVAFQ
jgi:hypothetical protein